MQYQSRQIKIGNLTLGGNAPLRLQSMTNTSTADAASSAGQVMRIAGAGGELVRLTAQNVKEAENLGRIKTILHSKGYNLPLIADIHFNPNAALEAAKHVEKVRINPGNYTDRYRKDKIHFTDEEYRQELERIQERLQPLVEACKKHHTAMRIGSNHGSLSQRIMSRYGDTPEGMAESAMEFLRIFKSLDYEDIVVSMKSSNTQVMTEATLLTVKKMQDEGLNFPVHLGVTEAGDGLEGRIKSAIGICGLLLHGIGDTIRVSLTEAPEKELPAARIIAETAKKHKTFAASFNPPENSPAQKKSLKGKPSPWVILNEGHTATNADFYSEKNKALPFHSIELTQGADLTEAAKADAAILSGSLQWQWSAALWLREHHPDTAIILKKEANQKDLTRFAIEMATELSVFLYYNMLDGLWLVNEQLSPEDLSTISFAILQASGKRITKTEYISCPSCGRTQFDIEKALKAVKEETSHLKGLKIGVMGCVVNGPGEMADADYGYVGSGKGLVTLYKGKQVKQKNIPQEEAIEALKALIQQEGDWVENQS